MTNNERGLLEIIESSIEYKLDCLNWKNEDIGFWIDGIIFNLNPVYSSEIFNKLYVLRDKYLGLEVNNMYQTIVEYLNGLYEKELKNLYEKYDDMAFTFYINSDKEKYNITMYVVQLIDNTLREKGYWKKI